jgi:hypothetical protein
MKTKTNTNAHQAGPSPVVVGCGAPGRSKVRKKLRAQFIFPLRFPTGHVLPAKTAVLGFVVAPGPNNGIFLPVDINDIVVDT